MGGACKRSHVQLKSSPAHLVRVSASKTSATNSCVKARAPTKRLELHSGSQNISTWAPYCSKHVCHTCATYFRVRAGPHVPCAGAARLPSLPPVLVPKSSKCVQEACTGNVREHVPGPRRCSPALPKSHATRIPPRSRPRPSADPANPSYSRRSGRSSERFLMSPKITRCQSVLADEDCSVA